MKKDNKATKKKINELNEIIEKMAYLMTDMMTSSEECTDRWHVFNFSMLNAIYIFCQINIASKYMDEKDPPDRPFQLSIEKNKEVTDLYNRMLVDLNNKKHNILESVKQKHPGMFP